MAVPNGSADAINTAHSALNCPVPPCMQVLCMLSCHNMISKLADRQARRAVHTCPMRVQGCDAFASSCCRGGGGVGGGRLSAQA